MIYEFFSGSYAEKGEPGIVKFRLDTEKGTLDRLFSYEGICHPSYLGFRAAKDVLYAVQEETPEGRVHALRVTERGLVPLADVPTGGADPCQLTLTRSEKLLFAANYSSGSLAVFPLEAGRLKDRAQLMVHDGRGKDPVRQEAPHAHYVKEHEGRIFVVDLGLDQIFLYTVDEEKGRLFDTGERIALPSGFGPRHLEFHRKKPELLYCIGELSDKIAVFRKEKDGWLPVQMISTLPETFSGASTAAAVKMQGDFLFASNRGHDSIAVYRVQLDGRLVLSRIAPSGGKMPRDFTMFDEYMVVANQDSDCISVLKFDRADGTLSPTGIEAKTEKPSCIRRYR